MSAAPLPGVLAVARRRALTAETDLAGLAYAGASAAALTAARVTVDERFGELAAVEAAADAASPPGRAVLLDRVLFARERALALTSRPGLPVNLFVLARRELAIIDVMRWLPAFACAAGLPVGGALAGLDADQIEASREIADDLWSGAIAAAGGSDGE